MQDPLASWAAIASAGATLILALFTLFNILISRRSLRLMELRERRWRSNLELYQVDTFFKRTDETGARILAVNMEVCNKSDADNSLKRMELNMKIVREEGVGSSHLIPPMPDDPSNLLASIDRGKDNLFNLPCLIGAHNTYRAWVLFKVDLNRFDDVDSFIYEIRVIDTQNKESSLSLGIIRVQND